ncbi:MAG: YkvA family protein [Weeksellaceae bacterium]
MSKLSLLTSFWRRKDDFKGVFTKEKFDALTRMIPLIYQGEYKPEKWSRFLLGVGALIYVLSPLDFIPEVALGPLGLLDDIAILAFAANSINKELNSFLDWEESERDILFVD